MVEVPLYQKGGLFVYAKTVLSDTLPVETLLKMNKGAILCSPFIGMCLVSYANGCFICCLIHANGSVDVCWTNRRLRCSLCEENREQLTLRFSIAKTVLSDTPPVETLLKMNKGAFRWLAGVPRS
jgi:hypothetical protein